MRFSSFLRTLINSSVIRTNPVINKTSIAAEPTLNYDDSVLILSLVLPSRQEKCRFHLDLDLSTIRQLINEIKQEDTGVEQVHIYDNNGNLISQSNSIKSLMNSPFTIQLNQQQTFLFDPINKLQIKDDLVKHTKINRPSTEETIAALYNSLNSMKVYHAKYFQLKNEANQLMTQLEPLEKIKNDLADRCQRYTTRYIWFGLAAMSFQVGILARLTWDCYSWDVVEPISYFMAYSTAMAFYAFHLMTRLDFEYMTLTDRIFLRRFHLEARHNSFDISSYNHLKDRLFSVNTDLARLRAPLSLSLPVPPNPLKCKISGEELSPLDFYRDKNQVE